MSTDASGQPAWLETLAPGHRQRVKPYEDPDPPGAMLAKLSQPGEIPAGWGFQRKWDGMRVLVDTRGAEPTFWARSGRRVTQSFPELAEAWARVRREAVVDGEVLVLREGHERFGLLQRRMNVEEPSSSLVAEIPVQLAVFDVLELDGYDTRRLPQRRREELLQEVASELPPVIVAETVAHGQPAARVREAACELGWEGLIAKDPTSTYRAGRHASWRKLKCLQRAEFTIVGYRELEPGGGVGSLVLAETTAQGGLAPVGSVGTGLTDRERERLLELLQPVRRETPPLEPGDVRGEVRWVEPQLEAEVAYGERTPDGNLRHPRLEGLASIEPREAPV